MQEIEITLHVCLKSTGFSQAIWNKKALVNFSQTTNFFQSLKNLPVLIYSKLHSKSFDYLYLFFRVDISSSHRTALTSLVPSSIFQHCSFALGSLLSPAGKLKSIH